MKPSRSIYADRLKEFPDIAFADESVFQQRGQWRDYFRQRIGQNFNGRLIFELGCFDAAYLSRIAAAHPNTAFIGLDWKCKAIHDGARRVAAMDLRNVALLRGRGQDVLKIFGAGEVDEIWVFHPDPCARPHEMKNRLITVPFLIVVHSVLRDGKSTLSLKTDHPGYYQWVLGLFGLPEPEAFRAAVPRSRARDLMHDQDISRPNKAIMQRFKVLANSADFWNDAAALDHTSGRLFSGQPTLFEGRFVKKRRPIHYFEIGKASRR